MLLMGWRGSQRLRGGIWSKREMQERQRASERGDNLDDLMDGLMDGWMEGWDTENGMGEWVEADGDKLEFFV
jgi:hypothetical protein